MDIRYSAGLFDGEGMIVISKKPTRIGRRIPTYQMQCKVGMTDKKPLDLFQEQWGGTVWSGKFLNPRWKPFYTWGIYSIGAREFLEDVLPHLIVKKERAVIAIEFQEHMSSSGLHRFGPGQGLKKMSDDETSEILMIRESYYQTMKELNYRGVKEQ